MARQEQPGISRAAVVCLHKISPGLLSNWRQPDEDLLRLSRSSSGWRFLRHGYVHQIRELAHTTVWCTAAYMLCLVSKDKDDTSELQSINHSNEQIRAESTLLTETIVAYDLIRNCTEVMMQRNRAAGEALRRTMQMVVEGQYQNVQETAQKFEEVSRKVAQAVQGTSEEVCRLAMLPQAAEGGLRDFQQGLASLVEGAVHANLCAAQELFRLVNSAPIIEMQQRFARDYLDVVMQGTATVARGVRRTADETLHPLNAQGEQRYRTVAQ